MKVPRGFAVNTGESEGAYELIDRFFCSVKKEAGERTDSYDHDFHIRAEGTCRAPDVYTDNIVHILQCKERVIAVVTETRTESNLIRFDFFKNLDGKLD